MRLLLFFFLLTAIPLQGQSDFFVQQPVRISVFTHTIGLPFRKMIRKPFNWGLSIGTEFRYGKKDPPNWVQSVQLGWYQHRHIGPGLFLLTSTNYRAVAGSGWYGSGGLSVGYLRYFSPTEQFELHPDGYYQRAANKGHNSLLFGAGLETGYQTALNNSWNAAPFLRYDYLIQTPFSKEVPLFPHALLHLGGHFIKSE